MNDKNRGEIAVSDEDLDASLGIGEDLFADSDFPDTTKEVNLDNVEDSGWGDHFPKLRGNDTPDAFVKLVDRIQLQYSLLPTSLDYQDLYGSKKASCALIFPD